MTSIWLIYGDFEANRLYFALTINYSAAFTLCLEIICTTFKSVEQTTDRCEYMLYTICSLSLRSIGIKSTIHAFVLWRYCFSACYIFHKYATAVRVPVLFSACHQIASFVALFYIAPCERMMHIHAVEHCLHACEAQKLSLFSLYYNAFHFKGVQEKTHQTDKALETNIWKEPMVYIPLIKNTFTYRNSMLTLWISIKDKAHVVFWIFFFLTCFFVSVYPIG